MFRYIIRSTGHKTFRVIDTTTNESVTQEDLSKREAVDLRERLIFGKTTTANVPALRSRT